MHEYRHSHLFTCLKDREEPGFAKIDAFHMRAYLNADKADTLAPLQFLDREFDILHGQRAKSDEALRVGLNDARDVVVQEFGKIQRVLGFGPVTEHHGHGTEHLHLHPVRVTFSHTHNRVPAVGLHFAEELVVHHHPCAARLVMVQMNESTVTEPPPEIRDVRRQDVRVYIDREQLHRIDQMKRLSASITWSHFEHVRNFSSP